MEEIIKLVCCIILPPAFSIMMVYRYVYRRRRLTEDQKPKIRDNLKGLFNFNPDKGLSHQPPLWLAFLTPISYFFTLGIISWMPYPIELSADGFNNFIKISTLPLALLSLCIPIAVLVSRLHATQQTANQIVVTKQKNNVDAFYAHRKAMAEYFSYVEAQNYEGDIKGDFQYHPRLHLKFFSHQDPNKGIPQAKPERFQQCLNLLEEARSEISKIMKSNYAHNTLINYIEANKAVSKLSEIMVLPAIYKFQNTWENKKSAPDIIIIGNSIHMLIGSYRYARSYLRILCEFSGYETTWFDTPPSDSSLRRADKSKVVLSSGMDGLYVQSVQIYLAHSLYIKT